MIIPGDTGHPYRLNKFVEYQHLAPVIDPLVMCRYAYKLDPDDCVRLAFYHSVAYCGVTAIWLLNNFVPGTNATKFWNEHKPFLIFGSARKHAKNMDYFPALMDKFVDEAAHSPFKWLKKLCISYSPIVNYDLIRRELNTWTYMGRFSIEIFLEAIIAMSKEGLLPGIDVEFGGNYDWVNGANTTSGLLNIFYADKSAEAYDKGEFKPSVVDMEYFLDAVLVAVKKKYPDQKQDAISVVGKICSFRNLFKGQRYGGFHHDRQLGDLRHYEEVYPDDWDIWDKIYKIRAEVFPEHMLGEKCGWDGIRPERKKLWIQKGLTGVEPNSM